MKLAYSIIGMVIGVAIDVVLYLAAGFFNEMTCGVAYDLCGCDGTMSTGSIVFFVFVVVISGVIGLISGINKDIEETKDAEKKKQQIEAAAFAECKECLTRLVCFSII